MKRALIALLMLTAMPTFANQKDPKYCSAVYDFAHIVMTKRQEGVSAYELMKLTEDDGLMQIIVETAFKLPAEPTQIKGKLAANDFAHRIFLICVENK